MSEKTMLQLLVTMAVCGALTYRVTHRKTATTPPRHWRLPLMANIGIAAYVMANLGNWLEMMSQHFPGVTRLLSALMRFCDRIWGLMADAIESPAVQVAAAKLIESCSVCLAKATASPEVLTSGLAVATFGFVLGYAMARPRVRQKIARSVQRAMEEVSTAMPKGFNVGKAIASFTPPLTREEVELAKEELCLRK